MASQVDLGALIIELRANSAQFQAAMDGARGKLGEVSQASRASGDTISKIAAALTRELVPGVEVSTREMHKLLTAAQSTTGVLGTLAKAGAAIGAAGLGYAIGNTIRNFFDLREAGLGFADALKSAVGQGKGYLDFIKQATEEQSKFTQQLNESRKVITENAKTLTELQGKNLASALGLAGQPGEAAKAERDARLQAIDYEKKLRDQANAELFRTNEKAASQRVQIEKQSADLAAAAKLGAELDYQTKLKKIREDEAANQLKLWQSQTEFLVDQFKARLKFRQDFEQGLGAGGLGGELTGIGAAGDVARRAEKDVRDLAGLRKLGRITDQEYFESVTRVQARAYQEAQKLYDVWYDFPTVMRAIGQAVTQLDTGVFSPLNAVLAQSTESTTKLLATDEDLANIQAQLNDQFSRVPQATGTAAVAVQKLANDYNDLAIQAAGATQQIYSAAAAMVYFHSVGG